MTDNISMDLFTDIDSLLNKNLFQNKNPFELIGPNLKLWLQEFLTSVGLTSEQPLLNSVVPQNATVSGRVYLGKNVRIDPYAYIQGPTYIADNATIRHGAYIRGNTYVGSGAIVGHSSEVKGSILLDNAKAAHFAYLGDAILCQNVNLGAGTKLANLPLKRSIIRYIHPLSGELLSSGLKKFSAILSDNSQTGCNSVLSPGTILMQNCTVLPCEHFRGTKK